MTSSAKGLLDIIQKQQNGNLKDFTVKPCPAESGYTLHLQPV